MPETAADREARARAFWSGTITFGLVSVPVNLFPANRPRRVSLRMLDEDGTPLARRYVCPEEGREVSRDEIVRGYELEDGSYVVVSDEELEALAPEKSRDIDLRVFVPGEQIDPFFFERAYFLTPAGGTTKAYRLLAEAMESSGRAGIATFVMRGKEYLVAILAERGILRAETLRFADELREPEQVERPDPDEAKAADVKRVAAAIRKWTASSLDETELEDDHARRLLALVERKQKKGEDVVRLPEAPPEEEEAEVIDLMEVLKRSMQAADERRPPKPAARRPRTAARDGGQALREQSKQQLYERAQALDIPGRSSMTKDELIEAIERSA